MPFDYVDIETGKSGTQKSYEELAVENIALRKSLQDIDNVLLEILMNQKQPTSGEVIPSV